MSRDHQHIKCTRSLFLVPASILCLSIRLLGRSVRWLAMAFDSYINSKLVVASAAPLRITEECLILAHSQFTQHVNFEASLTLRCGPVVLGPICCGWLSE